MKVLIAMSGGVDSSVAAALLAKQYGPKNVWGVYMKLHDDAPQCNINRKTCCGDQDAADAQEVAQKLGIMFDSLELQESFKNTVFKNYVSEIAAGRTPIPCTHCNSNLKFDLLFKYADLMGCDYVATGHYADNREAIFEVAEKDQTYYLWAIEKSKLSRILFPLSVYTKPEVRELAEAFGLINSQKPDSQNLCFIPDGKTTKFIDKHVEPCIGTIKHKRTQQVFRTDANLNHFTIGQRKALGFSSTEPLYVSRIDRINRIVWVDAFPNILTTDFTIFNPNYHTDIPIGDTVYVKLRSTAPLVACTRISEFEYRTQIPQLISPGQASVFYSLDRQLLGGGWIKCTESR